MAIFSIQSLASAALLLVLLPQHVRADTLQDDDFEDYPVSDEADYMMEEMDVNKNVKLDIEEIMNGIKKDMGHNKEADKYRVEFIEKLPKYFAAADANDDKEMD